MPHAPALGVRFPETNVRTYVRDARGRRGVFFLSLDAASFPAVLGARTLYRLPYMWSRMRVAADGNRVRYQNRRRHGPAAESDILVETGAPVVADELVRFLTGR